MSKRGGTRRSNSGATLCFVVIAFIAIAELLGSLVFPLIGIEGVFRTIAAWLLFVATLIAYIFIAWYAYGYVSRRSIGWKVAYWVIIVILLFTRTFGFFYWPAW